MICPICKREQEASQFQRHHVHWKSDGGSNDPVNLLDICKTCHAILTFGSADDAAIRNTACLAFQMSEYGLEFLIRSNLIYSEDSPFGAALVNKWANQSARAIDAALKEAGAVMYSQYMHQIHGELPILSKTEAGQ